MELLHFKGVYLNLHNYVTEVIQISDISAKKSHYLWIPCYSQISISDSTSRKRIEATVIQG
jgi:hypothetical protein